MTRHTRPIKGYWEENAYTGWRRVYAYLQKPGAVKFTKRVTHKRERREGKTEARKGQHE